MAEVKALKRLTFKRESGDIVIEAGESFTPDGTMDVDKMIRRGKIEGTPRAKRSTRRKAAN